MDISIAIIFLGSLIFFSHMFNSLFDKTKIPNVLLLMLIGIIVGPIGGWVSPTDFGQVGRIFTTITLVVILFESGVNLRFADIGKAFGSAFLITIINFIVSVTIAVVVIMMFTKLDFVASLFVGSIIGGTSSAVVIPMIKQLKLKERSETILSLESALSDVLCLIVALAVLGGMQSGKDLEMSDILIEIAESFLIALAIGIISGFVWSAFLKIFKEIKNSMFTSLAAVLIVYGLVEKLGYNGGIAALSFGIMLGNSGVINEKKLFKKIFAFSTVSLGKNEKDFFSELVFILQTYFFVFIGISIQFGNLWLYIVGLIIVAAIILSRPLSLKILSKKKFDNKDLAIMAIMTPKGLIPAVLASIPIQLGLKFGSEIQDLGFAVVLFSIIICSILVILVSKDPLFMTKLFKKNTSEIQTESVAENTEAGVVAELTEPVKEQLEEQKDDNESVEEKNE
ncbi:MAG: cation:proton antiporter [Bacteroidales bacterium]|nr:cation:proton antiporter [Bacteroidales bacterium]